MNMFDWSTVRSLIVAVVDTSELIGVRASYMSRQTAADWHVCV